MRAAPSCTCPVGGNRMEGKLVHRQPPQKKPQQTVSAKRTKWAYDKMSTASNAVNNTLPI